MSRFAFRLGCDGELPAGEENAGVRHDTPRLRVELVAALSTVSKARLPRSIVQEIDMEHVFIILFSIASIVAIAVSRTRVPYTVALVVVGLVVGSLNIVEPPALIRSLEGDI